MEGKTVEDIGKEPLNRPKPKHKVSIRGGFSDRNGIRPENIFQQLKDFDYRTRISIINLLNNCIHSLYSNKYTDDKAQSFIRDIRSNVYLELNDYSIGYSLHDVINMIQDTILYDDYDAVLSVVEYVCNRLCSDTNYEKDIVYLLNDLFKREYVGYRLINKKIIPITNDLEIEEIEESIDKSSKEISNHLQKALALISDRKSPDYENTIKESIIAVEAECNILLNSHMTLREALTKFEKNGIIIHPALKEAFIKIYGYAGDGKGIRHSGNLGGPDSTFAEAKFMIVACCAFINYLRSIASSII